MKTEPTLRKFLKITGLPIVFASLCCLTPVILVVFGLATASFAASLADTLYGTYRWVFRLIGLGLLGVSLLIYFRQKGVCTLDAAKKRCNEIINTVLLASVIGVIGYVVWLYVVVEYAGIWLKIWS